MLQSNSIRIVHYAVTTLHNLLLYVEMAKEEIIACGGLVAFVPHLRSRNNKLQALVSVDRVVKRERRQKGVSGGRLPLLLAAR